MNRRRGPEEDAAGLRRLPRRKGQGRRRQPERQGRAAKLGRRRVVHQPARSAGIDQGLNLQGGR